MFGVGTFALLAVLTFRAAWMASFINYDLANEYLVYAHAAPAVKTVLNDIEDLSRRTTDGMDLQFVYDNEVSWPYSWYFRDFNNATFTGSSPNAQQVDQAMVAVVGDANRSKFEPLLEDRFYRYEYIRLWWPMQDYFGLTPSRLAETVSLTPSAAQVRRGLWDIWWARDYTAYGNANDRSFALTEWPVADRMHVYVRKDFASQVWNLGVGEGTVPGLAAEDINVCNANWTSLTANQTYGDDIVMSNPIGMSVDGNRLYVAEQGGGQISIFDTQTGERLDTLGTPGTIFDAAGGTLDTEARPPASWSGPTASPLARTASPSSIRGISACKSSTRKIEFVTAFGERYERGADAQTQPVYGFWGPRDAVINQDGHLFIADTGNRRIRVYDENNEFLYDIGESGSGEGQLNEPAGLALHSDGRLYIADTWNRRVSVFDQTGAFLYTFRVRAWYTDRGNRPYLAIDEDRGYLYITDPEAGRVLVTDFAGNCVGSFGQAGEAGSTNNSQLAVAGGITLDDDGNVYVSDAASGRVLRFDPFPLPEDVTLYNSPADEPVNDDPRRGQRRARPGRG